MKNQTENQIIEINIENIKVNPQQPRKEFDATKLKELCESIKSRGLINPIRVKKLEDPELYELICGERRLRAHKLANMKTIKAIVKKYNSKSEEMTDSLIENLHRDDLTSIEKENFINKLWNTNKYKTKRDLAKTLGVDDATISQNIRAKNIREETGAANSISTRTLLDVTSVNTRKKYLKK
jgi:ParB family chromosome partitioning protein